MAYTPNYTSDDIAPAVIDASAAVLIQIVAFATIIGLLLVIVLALLLWKFARRGRG